MSLAEKISGALYGGAIGDGMGGPVEGWEPEAIRAKFAAWDITTFIPPQEWKPKGDGRITDDTLMVEALIRAYSRKADHVDAYDFRDFLLPEVVNTVVWLPERQQDMPIMERMNAVEKFAWFRLSRFGAEPRTAGIGNAINCAIAMFIWPVGAMNAGDPQAAYQEAAAFGMAESYSYAVEAAAVLAAAYAAAFAADASIDGVLQAAQRVARDATKRAIDAVWAATDPANDLDAHIAAARKAFLPYDHKDSHVPLEAGGRMSEANQPNPRLTIEEVPIALAALKWGNGDYLRTLKAGVFYGRDCDSIAGMACGLCGALRGVEAIPRCLREASNAANRRDWSAVAAGFHDVVRTVWEKDGLRHAARRAAIG